MWLIRHNQRRREDFQLLPSAPVTASRKYPHTTAAPDGDEPGAVERAAATDGDATTAERGSASAPDGDEPGAVERAAATGGDAPSGARGSVSAPDGEAATGKPARAAGARPAAANAAAAKAGAPEDRPAASGRPRPTAKKSARSGAKAGGAGRAGAGTKSRTGTPAKPGRAAPGQGGAADRQAGRAGTVAKGTAGGKGTTGNGTAGGKRTAGKGRRPPAGRAAAPVTGLVVGPVPIAARVAGGLALAGALCRLIAVGLPVAHVRGRGVGGAANLFDWLVVLPFAAVVGAAGLLVLLGRLPRLGLAAIRTTGLAAAALLAETIYLLEAGRRTTIDLPLGIGTSLRYSVGSGLALLAVGYGLLVLALLAAQLGWPRTVMEDDGRLDRLRPRMAAWGLLAGIFAAIVLGMSPFASSRAHLAPAPVPERAGWDLAGGALLCLAVGAAAVIAATLQPRLAAVGGYAGLAAVLATQGLAAALLAARSPVIAPSAGGIGTLLAALVFALFALAAWRLSRAPAADPAEPARR
jgi:iron complex transport system permease protein